MIHHMIKMMKIMTGYTKLGHSLTYCLNIVEGFTHLARMSVKMNLWYFTKEDSPSNNLSEQNVLVLVSNSMNLPLLSVLT